MKAGEQQGNMKEAARLNDKSSRRATRRQSSSQSIARIQGPSRTVTRRMAVVMPPRQETYRNSFNTSDANLIQSLLGQSLCGSQKDKSISEMISRISELENLGRKLEAYGKINKSECGLQLVLSHDSNLSGKTPLDSDYKEYIKAVAAILAQYPKYRIIIEYSTDLKEFDHVGTDQNQAQKLASQLKTAGLDGKRIHVRGRDAGMKPIKPFVRSPMVRGDLRNSIIIIEPEQ